jgi:nicotinate phosphoribosyltransferase
MKLSAQKSNLPGRKHVFRQYEGDTAMRDVIATEEEQLDGAPLMDCVMTDGERTDAGGSRPADAIREHAAARLAELPDRLRRLDPEVKDHEVVLSGAMEERLNATRESLRGTMTAEAP